MAVYKNDASISYDKNVVLDTWADEFDGLYNAEPEPCMFDENLYESILQDKVRLET